MGRLLKIFLPYSLLVGVGIAVWVSNHRPEARAVITEHTASTAQVDAGDTASNEKVHLDPVCHMEVTSSWGFEVLHLGKSYHFCSMACRDSFAKTPDNFLGDRCTVCKELIDPKLAKTATYMSNTYRFCGQDHRRDFKADPASFFMHTMWGIPSWMYYLSIAAVLVVSFGLFEWIDRWQAMLNRRRQLGRSLSAAVAAELESSSAVVAAPAPSDRIDLLKNRVFHFLTTSRVFRFIMQASMVVMFFLIIAAGLFGNQNPALNIAPLMTWTIWWGGLILLIMFAGKAWCYVCPWDAVAGWMEKLRFWKKTNDGLGLNMKWPKVARNVLIATVMFVGLTWIELGFGVTMKPRVTSYLAIAMLLMAIVSAFLFERKGFCRYACLVGRVSGLYAMFSGVEIRSKSEAVCKSCRGKECVRGSETAYGCPTFLYPGKLTENTYCIQCTECIQACPEDNMTINLRPWGADLAAPHKQRTDEAYLALLMLSITGFHGLTMTANWANMTGWLHETLSASRLVSFSLGMTAIMLAPILIYAALVYLSYRMGTNTPAVKQLAYHDYFVRYAYALLPIALFYHLAHNMEHLLMEGPKVVSLLSDPFGWGWNLFGTLDWTVPPLVSLDVLWIVQIALVLVGHVYSLWIAQRTSVRLFGHRRAALRSQLPMLIGMIAFSIFSLWLLKQPMEMRTSAM